MDETILLVAVAGVFALGAWRLWCRHRRRTAALGPAILRDLMERTAAKPSAVRVPGAPKRRSGRDRRATGRLSRGVAARVQPGPGVSQERGPVQLRTNADHPSRSGAAWMPGEVAHLSTCNCPVCRSNFIRLVQVDRP